MDSAEWRTELDALMQRVADWFTPVEKRQRARVLVWGPVSDVRASATRLMPPFRPASPRPSGVRRRRQRAAE